MITQFVKFPALMLVSSVAVATPVVTDNLISWPDNGWYQVQQVTDNTIINICEGGRSCEVTPGNYIVINHTSGERFNSVVPDSSAQTSSNSPVAVNGTTISWPDDGWYQVLNERDYTEVCAGTRFCEVTPGSYLVINHTTQQRFDGVEIPMDHAGPTSESPIVVNGSNISWPNDGWYQVIDQSDYSSLCEGGSSCEVTPGVYDVINHTTVERWNDIVIDDIHALLTRVDIGINVPRYQSNELQVQVTSNDKTWQASWSHDESWFASGDFPSNSEQQLTITFSDRNGDIELGRLQRTYNTGEGPTHSIIINADEFDTRADTDGDGVSNLAELIAGSDPLVPDNNSLPIRGMYSGYANALVLQPYEVPQLRNLPYSAHSFEPVGSSALSPTRTTTRTLEFDANGNGTHFYTTTFNSESFYFLQLREGTRTHTGNSIVWSGDDYSFGTSHELARDIDFHVEATRIDEQRLQIDASYNTEYLHPSKQGEFEVQTYSLSVVTQYDPRTCLPDRGTFTNTFTDTNQNYTRVITLTKNEGDEYWHVVRTRNGEVFDEYLTPWLNMEVYCRYYGLD